MKVTAKINNDPNAGNGSSTYWRSHQSASRRYSVQFVEVNDFLRDSADRVRRFATRKAAIKAAQAAGFEVVE